MNEFAESFGLADEVIVSNVYCARENDETAGRSGAEELVAQIRRHGGHARYLATFAVVADHLAANLTEGDLVMTMGAGDIWKLADELVQRLCQPDGMRRTPRSEHVVSPGGAYPVSVSAA
jgi:UDP-N-acetylmuramate--alanine ligase